jgi:hypothetical protein
MIVLYSGVRGTFYSKRLFHAILNFSTDFGRNKELVQEIAQKKYGFEFLEPSIQLEKLMNETRSNFQSFHDEEKIEIFHYDEYYADDVMFIYEIYGNNVDDHVEGVRQNKILQERNVVRQSLRIHDPRNRENRIDRDRHPHPWHMQMMATRIGRELIRIQNGETTIQSPCVKLQTPDLRLIREYVQTATSGVYLPFPPEPYRTYFTLYHISEDKDLGIECC